MFLALGLFLSGILINPMSPSQTSKLVVADVFLLAGIASLLLSALSGRGRISLGIHRSVHGVFVLLCGFLVWVFLSGSVAISLHDQRAGAFVLTFANYLYGAIVCVAIVAASARPVHFGALVTAYTLGVVLVSSFSAVAMFGDAPDWAYHGGGRIKSTSQSVNQLAAYVAPAIPLVLILSLGHAVRRGRTLFFGLSAALAGLALIGTGSRTALVLLLVSLWLVALAALVFWRSKRSLASTILLGCGGMVVGLVYLVVSFRQAGSKVIPEFASPLSRPLDRFLSPGTVEAGLGPRYDQMESVLSNWIHHPAFGIGPGNFKSFFASDFEVHNTYFATLIETGVPGLLLLLAFQATILWACLRMSLGSAPAAMRIAAFAVFSAFLVVSLYGLGSFGLRQRPFWIQAGLAIGLVNQYWMAFGPGRKDIARCSA